MDDPLAAALAKMLSAADRETLAKGLELRTALGRLQDAVLPIADIANNGDSEAIDAVESFRREFVPKLGNLVAAANLSAALSLCTEKESQFRRIKLRMAN
jgi:hypothetical protein